MTELVIPEKLDTLQLSAATKAAVAVGVFGSSAKINVTGAETVAFSVDGVQLIEPNAIVRYLSKTSAKQDKTIDVAESVLYDFVKRSEKLDNAAAAAVAAVLPKNDLSAGSVVLFGDLHALVTARGKAAIAADAPLTMFYHRMLNVPRVKSALGAVQKAEFVAAGAKDVKASKDVGAAAAATGAAGAAAAGAAGAAKAAPAPVPACTAGTKATPKPIPEAAKIKPQEHPILPKEGARNILITSALPYVNNVPHLGNIIGSVLSADFYARYARNRGYNTLYICGTDEYGTATETKALEEKVSPLELCTKYHHIHKQVYDWFQIGFDHFGRTSTPQQTEICQKAFLQCNDNGYLEEHEQEQLYCEEHNAFLADRFVEGTCPKCGFDDARGDQCDGCGQLLEPTELINPRCKVDGATPKLRTTKHMYLSLQKLQPKLEEWIAKDNVDEGWSRNARQITQNWLKGGLQARAITRDLKWGVPVPLKGYENKVLYVWFDAPMGYPSITASYTPEWEKWWKNPDNVKLYQFMGKDNVPFHTVIFPSTEIATGDNWTKLSFLSTTEYLQYEGGKFSKSRNLGVFGNNAQEINIPASVWRYYLATARPETSDSQFSWTDFVARNNTELLANLGNFVNRVIKFTNAKYTGYLAPYDAAKLSTYPAFQKDVDELLQKYIAAMEKQQLREGLDLAMRISARGNVFLQDNKLDNTLFAEHPEQCAALIGVAVNLIYLLSAVISPFMPETSTQILEQLQAPAIKIPDTFELLLTGGHAIGKAKYLFSRIDEKMVKEWQAKYGGSQVAKEPELSKKQLAKQKKAERKAKEAAAAAATPDAAATESKADAATEAKTETKA